MKPYQQVFKAKSQSISQNWSVITVAVYEILILPFKLFLDNFLILPIFDLNIVKIPNSCEELFKSDFNLPKNIVLLASLKDL